MFICFDGPFSNGIKPKKENSHLAEPLPNNKQNSIYRSLLIIYLFLFLAGLRAPRDSILIAIDHVCRSIVFACLKFTHTGRWSKSHHITSKRRRPPIPAYENKSIKCRIPPIQRHHHAIAWATNQSSNKYVVQNQIVHYSSFAALLIVNRAIERSKN